MLPKLNQAARRQILKDIGIDVWLPRGGVSALAAQPPVGAGRAVADVDSPARSAPTVPVEQPLRPLKVEASAPEPVEPFAVLSVTAAGVMVLLEGTPTRREGRLIRDLLSAATGEWGGQPSTRRFDWPPALDMGIATAIGADAADRALRAFVAKDVADHQVALLIATGALIGRFQSLRAQSLRYAGVRLEVSSLDLLSRDPMEKRRVWAALAAHRVHARGRQTQAATGLPRTEPEPGAPTDRP